MSRAEDALQGFYEDASLRDELRDDEANELLKWAESELTKLDATGADDAVFEEKLGELRRLLRGMNRFVGRRQEITAQADDESLVKLTEHANALGYALSAEQLAQQAGELASLDAMSAIKNLTSLINETGTPAHSHTEPPIEAEPKQSTHTELPAEIKLTAAAQTESPTPDAAVAPSIGTFLTNLFSGADDDPSPDKTSQTSLEENTDDQESI